MQHGRFFVGRRVGRIEALGLGVVADVSAEPGTPVGTKITSCALRHL